MDAERITGIYERKLIRRLLHTDTQMQAAHTRLIEDTAPILSQYRAAGNGAIIRSPELDRQLNKAIDDFRIRIRDEIMTSQQWAWNLSDEKNDMIINSFISKMPVSGIATEGLFRRNLDAFDSFQSRKNDGLHLSDRVWNLGEQNKKLLDDYIDKALITGRKVGDFSRDIREILKEPNRQFRRVRNPRTGKLELSREARKYTPGTGVYRSSAKNAKRLARTETNMAYRTSDQERWKGLDFVLGYEVKISNRHPLPDICDQAAGRYPKNFKFVGWHPQCLCYAIPILPTKDQFMDNLVDGTELPGEVNDIPKSMKDYIEANRDRIGNYKRQPFWVQDNFSGKRITGSLNSGIFPAPRPALSASQAPATAAARAARRTAPRATQGTLDFNQPAQAAAPAPRPATRATQGTMQFGQKPAAQVAARSAQKLPTAMTRSDAIVYVNGLQEPERTRLGKVLQDFIRRNRGVNYIPRAVLESPATQTAAKAVASVPTVMQRREVARWINNLPDEQQRARAKAILNSWAGGGATPRPYDRIPMRIFDDIGKETKATTTLLDQELAKKEFLAKWGRLPEFEGDTGRIGMNHRELMNAQGSKVMREAFGEDRHNWVKNFHAKEENYLGATYYRVEPAPGEFRGAGAGKGLYLGRDKQALRNFYDPENFMDPTTTPLPVSEFTHPGGKGPKWLDLTDRNRWDAFKLHAEKNGYTIETWGELVQKMGYDGIRYFDPMATGEEFVLFNTKVLQKAVQGTKKAQFAGTPMTLQEQIKYLKDPKNGWSKNVSGLSDAEIAEKLETMAGFNFREFDDDMKDVYKAVKSKKKILGQDYFIISGDEFSLQRIFFADGRVEHSYLKIPDRLQGKDTGKRILGSCYKQYNNMPQVTKITIHANIDVGGYAWCKYGFEMNRSSVASFINRIGPERLNATHAQEMRNIYSKWRKANPNAELFPGRLWAEQPWGKDLLLNTHWWGELNLKNQEVTKIFEAYLTKKK